MVTAEKKKNNNNNKNNNNKIACCRQILSRMCLRKIQIAREWVVVVVVGWGDLLPKVSGQ